jgi:multidrug transporter EmrE-like cation transporter
MINWHTLGYGLTFGALDSIALPIVKGVSIGWSKLWMIIPVLMYGASPFLLLSALKRETLTIMNLVWDLTSDLVVTLIGLVVFAESITPMKALGVFFSFIALFCMSYESATVNEFLTNSLKRIRENFNGLF